MILLCALTFRCDFSYHSVRGGQGCQYLTLTVELLVKFYSGQTTCKENIVHQVKVRKKKVTSISPERGAGWTQMSTSGLDKQKKRRVAGGVLAFWDRMAP